MENRELHPNLQAALQLVEGIFQMLGSRYEVILHDLSHVESSIVALAGDVTHRKIGGPVTNYLLQADLGGGKAVFPKGIALQSNLLKLVSNGSVNLINDKIDFDVRPFSGKIVDTNAVQALSSFIKVKGTIENPKIALDSFSFLRSFG